MKVTAEDTSGNIYSKTCTLKLSTFERCGDNNFIGGSLLFALESLISLIKIRNNKTVKRI